MIQQLLFDFDGVIHDSMAVRDAGFEEIFAHYPPDQVSQLMAYHRANGGLSRYVKIRYFYEQVLGKDISEAEVQAYAASFSQIMRRRLPDPALLIADTVGFIRAQHARYPMHVVSGSDQEELRYLCGQLQLTPYFVSIHGSPTPKKQLVAEVLRDYAYRPEETLLIGDSVNDYAAAQVNGVGFAGYNNAALREKGGYLDSFGQFAEQYG